MDNLYGLQLKALNGKIIVYKFHNRYNGDRIKEMDELIEVIFW